MLKCHKNEKLFIYTKQYASTRRDNRLDTWCWQWICKVQYHLSNMINSSHCHWRHNYKSYLHAHLRLAKDRWPWLSWLCCTNAPWNAVQISAVQNQLSLILQRTSGPVSTIDCLVLREVGMRVFVNWSILIVSLLPLAVRKEEFDCIWDECIWPGCIFRSAVDPEQ